MNDSKNPEVSIIVVNYNTGEFLQKCLKSIPSGCEVIVIDNASTDDSLQKAIDGFPNFKYYKFSKNLGFARACNAGVYLSRGKYLLFLNPDSVIVKKGFKRCMKLIKKKRDAGAVTGKVIYPSGIIQPNVRKEGGVLNFLFGRTSFLKKLFPGSVFEKNYFYEEKELQYEREVALAAAMFFLVKKDIFLSIGGFDERFFLYWEDFDLSVRLRKNGLKIYYVPETVAVHYLGKSAEKNKKFAQMHKLKGFYNFIKKHRKLKRIGVLTLFFLVCIRIVLLLSFK